MEVFTMALNDFLKSRIPTARKIVKKLDKEFDYISIQKNQYQWTCFRHV